MPLRTSYKQWIDVFLKGLESSNVLKFHFTRFQESYKVFSIFYNKIRFFTFPYCHHVIILWEVIWSYFISGGETAMGDLHKKREFNHLCMLSTSSGYRDILENIWDGAFHINSSSLSAVNYLGKNLHRRCLTVFRIRFWNGLLLARKGTKNVKSKKSCGFIIF